MVRWCEVSTVTSQPRLLWLWSPITRLSVSSLRLDIWAEPRQYWGGDSFVMHWRTSIVISLLFTFLHLFCIWSCISFTFVHSCHTYNTRITVSQCILWWHACCISYCAFWQKALITVTILLSKSSVNLSLSVLLFPRMISAEGRRCRALINIQSSSWGR